MTCPHCDRPFLVRYVYREHVIACQTVKTFLAQAEDVERRRAMMRHPANGNRRS